MNFAVHFTLYKGVSLMRSSGLSNVFLQRKLHLYLHSQWLSIHTWCLLKILQHN